MISDSLQIEQAPAAFATFAAKHNKLASMIRGMKGVNGVTISQSNSNIVIDGNGAGGASPTPQTPASTTITGTTATFAPFTINGLLASNYLTGVTVPSSGTKYLTLNCTANNGQITAATIAAEAAPPAAVTPYAGQPPVAFGVLIAISIDAVATQVWTGGNIIASSREAFRISAASPVAGQLPYSVYYTWEISAA